MEQQAPPPSEAPAPPPPRRNLMGIVLVVLAIGGSAAGVFIYQLLQVERKSGVDTSGFDIAQTTDANRPVATSAPQQQQSSLTVPMTTGMGELHFGSKATAQSQSAAQQTPAQAYETAATSFSELCVQNEAKVRAFTTEWTKRSPSLQRYGREWMSYPDLKKLNDDYMRYHDPVAFMRGLAGSPNFPKLVTKYATDSSMQQFVHAGMKQVPSDLFHSGIAFVNHDDIAKKMVTNVMGALGIPAAALGGGDDKVDSSKIISGVMGNNPQLQKAMDSNPEIQKKIQDATSGVGQQQIPH